MDTMILNKKDGTTEEVEIMMSFKLEEFNNSDYVFYKNNEGAYFAAKYIEKDGNTELITDLSENERNVLSRIFDKFKKGGIL